MKTKESLANDSILGGKSRTGYQISTKCWSGTGWVFGGTSGLFTAIVYTLSIYNLSITDVKKKIGIEKGYIHWK